MTKILTIFVSLLIFTTGIKAQEEKDWTLLLYVIGTDIVQDAITDIEEMKAAGNTDNVNIVGMLGGSNLAGWQNPAVSNFVDGAENSVVYTPNEPMMVSTSNLSQFIDWGVENYPAEKYMLAFYNHGMAIRGWGHDETTDTQFTVSNLKVGIENSAFIQQGHKFDLLAFDACLMANLEAQVAMQALGDYFIASEEEEPWHAWNWTPIISAMNSQPNLTVPQLGEIIVDGFIEHSVDKETHAVALSLIDLTKIPDLVSSIETVFTSLDDDIYLQSLIRARSKSEEYGKVVSDPSLSEDVVDIGDLFKHLKTEEPGIAGIIDDVLSDLNSAVVYERSDDARPQATGITMYVPLNQFSEEAQLNYVLDTYYTPLPFSQTIQNFIKNDYSTFALSDDASIPGAIDNSLGVVSGSSSARGVLGENYSAIRIEDDHHGDLHQIQVVLHEEIIDMPDEFVLLGSTVPDTVVNNPDGSKIYGYKWDEEWLSVNGFPAYVSDIQDFDVLDETGNISHSFTRIHIPAILNPDSPDSKGIVLDYIYDEDFNVELEGIDRESYESESGFVVTAKDRIHLQPGDEVQLMYEVFDAQTHEGAFVPEPNAIINIQNGNEDLVLEHSQLPIGNYHIGFVLMDHAHNDTIIYDPMVREIVSSGLQTLPLELAGVTASPNPSVGIINIDFQEPNDSEISVYNSNGQLILQTSVRQKTETIIDITGQPAGVYYLKVQIDQQAYGQKILKL